MSITIRDFEYNDLDQVAKLFDGYRVFYKQASDLPRAKKFIEERFNLKESRIFVAESKNDTLAGFIQLFPSFTSVGTERIYILNDLFVSKEFRRFGIAEMLMQKAMDFGKSTGRIKIILETGNDNIQAQALYDKIGFKKDSNFIYYYDL